VANAPAAEVADAPSGDRPEVIADCGLDAANAVADRLQRADVTTINVIGGCHYVDIQTTLEGNRIANATTAQQICDSATEVAYSGGILGITVTDRAGHERASGANGEPCSGFP
jgi:methylaspartate ammonia-lyase